MDRYGDEGDVIVNAYLPASELSLTTVEMPYQGVQAPSSPVSKEASDNRFVEMGEHSTLVLVTTLIEACEDWARRAAASANETAKDRMMDKPEEERV